MRTANLVLHTGGQTVTYGDVHNVHTPERTKSWVPVAHSAIVDEVRAAFRDGGLQVVNESHALAREGKRYFGLFQVANGHERDDYGLVIGVRNSHDQSYPAGLVLGAQVFVCDNLSFSGQIKLARKHTTYIRRDLPALVHRGLGLLSDLRVKQDQRYDRYKSELISDAHAHHLVIRAVRAGALPGSGVLDVANEWETPSHEEFAADKTIWRLYNAFTEVLKGSLVQLPGRTHALHGLLDTYCGINDVIEATPQYAHAV